MLGMFLAFVAAWGWGSNAVFVRLALQRMPVGTGVLISLVTGLLFVGTLALVLNFHAFLTVSTVALGWLMLLGFINFPLGRLLVFNGIHLVGVARAAPILATSPLFAALWAISLGGERPGALTLLGGFAVVVGVIVVVSERQTQV